MSTQNVYDKYTFPTNEVLAQYFVKTSMEQLKKNRFDFGCGVDKNMMREMMRLERFACNNICYLNDEQNLLLREQVIKNTILKLFINESHTHFQNRN